MSDVSANGGTESPDAPSPAPPVAPSVTRGRPGARALVIAFVALIAILAGSALAWYLTSTIPTPDVSGLTLDQASEGIRASGLILDEVAYDEAAQGETGTVFSQEPVAGRRVNEGERVSLVIVGPPPVVTPDLAGLDRAAALARLTEVGLEAGELVESFDASVNAGLLISQDPASGDVVPRGSPVALQFSKGPQPVPVPKVVGLTQEAATASIEDAGLAVEIREQPDSAEKGTVIGQEPVDGEVLPGSTVAIVVSSGVEMVRVPRISDYYMSGPSDIYDSGWPDAFKAHVARQLRALGLESRGTVVLGSSAADRQNPAPGSLVPKGTTVTWTFYISG